MAERVHKNYANRAWRSSQGIALALALTLAALVFVLAALDQHANETTSVTAIPHPGQSTQN